MKLTIRKQGAYWNVDFNGAHRFYPDYLGAVTYADKTWRRYYKEQAAHSMLLALSANLLEADELALYTKLRKNKCAGITVKQYGYIKGIYERQKRAW